MNEIILAAQFATAPSVDVPLLVNVDPNAFAHTYPLKAPLPCVALLAAPPLITGDDDVAALSFADAAITNSSVPVVVMFPVDTDVVEKPFPVASSTSNEGVPVGRHTWTTIFAYATPAPPQLAVYVGVPVATEANKYQNCISIVDSKWFVAEVNADVPSLTPVAEVAALYDATDTTTKSPACTAEPLSVAPSEVLPELGPAADAEFTNVQDIDVPGPPPVKGLRGD